MQKRLDVCTFMYLPNCTTVKKKKKKQNPKNSVLCGNVFAVYFPSDVK